MNARSELLAALEDIMLCALSSDVSKEQIAKKAHDAIAKAKQVAA